MLFKRLFNARALVFVRYNMTDKFERLPTFAKPEQYRIYLEPDLEKFTSNGRVEIKLNFTEPTDFVKLHFGCKEFKSTKLTLENEKEWTSLKFDVDKKWKLAKISFPEKLQPQKATLTIDFDNEITTGLVGFYRSNYKDIDGNQKWLASTQFESESARLAFPCFDEPMFKARFDVELLVDEKLVALSNTNVIKEEKKNGKKLIKFATTPIMSSYLVAFAIGDFEYIETKYRNNIPIRVYVTRGKSHQAHFMLNVAKSAMIYMEEWFDYPMPLPKVDIVGIPDFAMGAMENFGLVTFRDMLLLTNQDTSYTLKNHAGQINFHELGHFWFGNLVTMKWWSDLWLKEGFATFCEYLFFDRNYPEFKTMHNFLIETLDAGQEADEIRSSHPIEVQINQPCDLDSYYDSITYEKSCSVITMLYYYLGEDTFKSGLRRYIKKFAFSNAETQDLWNALSEASGQNINQLMNSWTKQMGFPLVTVEEERLSGNKRRLKLKQTRYLADGTTDDQVWQIPLTVIKTSSAKEPFHKCLFTQREQIIELDNVGENEWIKLNFGTSGFYRVQYSNDMLDRLLKAISANELGVKDRFGLASDLSALMESGKIPAERFLAFFATLSNEPEYIVWKAAMKGISSIRNLLDRHDPALKSKFNKFAVQILEPVATRLGWEFEKNEDPHKSMLRVLILNLLFGAEHEETIKKGLNLFNEYVSGNTNAVHTELRSLTFNVGAKNHPQAVEHLLKIHETSGNGEIERNCISALGRTKCEVQRKKIFDDGIIGKKFRAQDMISLFYGSISNASNQDFAWNWFKQSYPQIIGRVNGQAESAVVTRILEVVSNSQSSDAFVKEFEDFYNSLEESIQKAWSVRYKQSLERVQLNASVYKNQQASIAAFLNNN